MEDIDASAIERAKAGDGDAFRLLVERHSRSVFRLAYRMTGNEFDAEEVVQETFLRAYKQLGHYESRASFATWIYRIATNYALDLIRSRKRHRDRRVMSTPETDVLAAVASGSPGQDRLYQSGVINQRLHEAIGTLSEQERTAFLLRHFEGRSIEEIGAILDIGVSASKNSIFRAVRKLREALEPVV